MTEGTLGVDVGGTFSDVVVWNGAELSTAKVPTTHDQSEGVVAGAAAAGASGISQFLHGTTVATNALLEREGATTALVTDDGFVDVIEIGRQDRPSLYDSFADRPAALVPPERRFGAGTLDILKDLSEVDAVAISLLHAYRDPADELRLRRRDRASASIAVGVAFNRGCPRVPRIRAHFHDGPERIPHARRVWLFAAPGRPGPRCRAPTIGCRHAFVWWAHVG